MKKQKENITIIDTTFYDYEYTDYVEFCEANDITPEDKDSEDFEQWCIEERDRAYDYGMEELEGCNGMNVDGACVVTGHLGLWWGSPEIQPKKFNCLHDAVLECSKSADDLKVELTPQGFIEVSAYHHDGTNCFTIYKLNAKGDNIVNLTEVKPYMTCKYKFN